MTEGESQSWRSHNGRTRRRKRSSPRSANDQNKIRCTTTQKFRFDVEIPNHYKDLDASRLPGVYDVEDGSQEKIASVEEGSPAVASDSDRANGGDETTTDASPKETDDDKPPAKSGQDQPTEQEEELSHHSYPLYESRSVEEDGIMSKMHHEFTTALEKHGASVGAWDAISSELKWKVEDVKVYAYSYFKALVRDRNAETCDNLVGNGDGRNRKSASTISSAKGTNQSSSSWSLHELVLLDSLMMKYCQDLSCLDVKEGNKNENKKSYLIHRPSVWAKIASQFPSKTESACKKVGSARLLKVAYAERGTANEITR